MWQKIPKHWKFPPPPSGTPINCKIDVDEIINKSNLDFEPFILITLSLGEVPNKNFNGSAALAKWKY